MRILIANSSPDPIYDQIVRQVKAQIIAGDLREGEPLPSIRKLAQELQISVITTKRAYDELESRRASSTRWRARARSSPPRTPSSSARSG